MDPTIPLTVKGVCLDVAVRVLLCRHARWTGAARRSPSRRGGVSRCLVRENREETGLPLEVADLIAAYPHDVLPGRWVDVIVYGCEIAHPARLQTSDEHDAWRAAPRMIRQESSAAAEGTNAGGRRAEVGGSAVEWVINELIARATARGAAGRPRHRNYERRERPNPASIKVLSERAVSDRCAVAVAVEDADGKGYIVIGAFGKSAEQLRSNGWV